MGKFKVGDIVQIIANLSNHKELNRLINMKGRIVDIGSMNCEFPYYVNIFNLDYSHYDNFTFNPLGNNTKALRFCDEELRTYKPKLKKFLEEYKKDQTN